MTSSLIADEWSPGRCDKPEAFRFLELSRSLRKMMSGAEHDLSSRFSFRRFLTKSTDASPSWLLTVTSMVTSPQTNSIFGTFASTASALIASLSAAGALAALKIRALAASCTSKLANCLSIRLADGCAPRSCVDARCTS